MNDRYVAYAGTYTHESSKGIHIYDMDVEKGRITERCEVTIDNPSYITLSSNKKYLYAICDQGISAFAITEDGSLELMNVASINGMRGCHISVTKDNRFLVISGYHDGKITVMHINADGSLGDIADEVFHKGLGSVAERNFRPHISHTCFTPDELKDHYKRGGLGDVKVKKFLLNVLNKELEPIRNRRHEYEKDIPYVYEILKQGTKNAYEVAEQTLSEVKAAMKINYFDDVQLINAQSEKYSG